MEVVASVDPRMDDLGLEIAKPVALRTLQIFVEANPPSVFTVRMLKVSSTDLMNTGNERFSLIIHDLRSFIRIGNEIENEMYFIVGSLAKSISKFIEILNMIAV